MSEREVSERESRLSTVIDIVARGSPKHALSTTKVSEAYVVEYGAYTTAQVRVFSVYTAISWPMMLDELLTCYSSLSWSVLPQTCTSTSPLVVRPSYGYTRVLGEVESRILSPICCEMAEKKSNYWCADRMIKRDTGIDSYIAWDTRTRVEVMREDEKLTLICTVHCIAVIHQLRAKSWSRVNRCDTDSLQTFGIGQMHARDMIRVWIVTSWAYSGVVELASVRNSYHAINDAAVRILQAK